MSNKGKVIAAKNERDAEERYRRRFDPDGKPPSLWNRLEEKLNELTEKTRIKAQHTIRHQRLELDKKIKTLTSEFTEAAAKDMQALIDAERELGRQFTAVVNGGVKGAVLAINALMTFGPPPSTTSQPD
ncbi:MAG TPA: hypothetical protein VIF12_03890 [Micavibrio sp.]